MSVFTALSLNQLQELLSHYPLGECVGFSEIRTGTVNSNFYVETTEGQFVLTLFETLKSPQILSYLHLLDFLSDQGIACPAPEPDCRLSMLQTVQDKPAVLMGRLDGQSLEIVSEKQCYQISSEIAKMHRATKQYVPAPPDYFAAQWLQESLDFLDGKLSSTEKTLLHDELQYQKQQIYHHLPHTVIHADIFRDNVLFDDENLSGIIDFYFSCYRPALFDIGILINDWAFSGQKINTKHRQAILDGYQAIRPLTDIEQHHLSNLCRQVALRFWVSRLAAKYSVKRQANILIKDPDECMIKLLFHRENY